MSYSTYPQPPKVYREWVDTIKSEASDKLSSWETTFIDSIDQTLNRHQSLSETQAHKLEDIYAEHTE